MLGQTYPAQGQHSRRRGLDIRGPARSIPPTRPGLSQPQQLVVQIVGPGAVHGFGRAGETHLAPLPRKPNSPLRTFFSSGSALASTGGLSLAASCSSARVSLAFVYCTTTGTPLLLPSTI